MQFKKKRWHCQSGQPITELDKQVMYWENKGRLVPTRDLIKTPEQIEGIRAAGVINTAVLDAVAAEIHAGMNTLEIDKICYDICTSHGATPACLNYEGFPKSVCTSINEVVCHGIPKEEDVLEEGDIINVDFTTIYNGYFADASRMFIIGKTTPEKEQLVWLRNAWILVPRLLSHSALLATSVMPSRSMPRNITMALCATSADMA